ncbi:hypothetical protein Tco_0805644 [Tanacetum coccineum]
MFALTHELSYYRIRDVTYARFHYSIMEGLINCLWNIGNPISEAFKVLCIVQSITDEYSPYIFKFIETCKDPMLMELYEVMCKAEDDLRINPLDKTNKYKAIDEENDEQVTGRTELFFYEPVTTKEHHFPSVIIAKILGIRLGYVSNTASSRRKACLVAVRITVQHQALRKINLKIHQRHEEFKEDEPDASSDFLGYRIYNI